MLNSAEILLVSQRRNCHIFIVLTIFSRRLFLPCSHSACMQLLVFSWHTSFKQVSLSLALRWMRGVSKTTATALWSATSTATTNLLLAVKLNIPSNSCMQCIQKQYSLSQEKWVSVFHSLYVYKHFQCAKHNYIYFLSSMDFATITVLEHFIIQKKELVKILYVHDVR